MEDGLFRIDIPRDWTVAEVLTVTDGRDPIFRKGIDDNDITKEAVIPDSVERVTISKIGDNVSRVMVTLDDGWEGIGPKTLTLTFLR